MPVVALGLAATAGAALLALRAVATIPAGRPALMLGVVVLAAALAVAARVLLTGIAGMLGDRHARTGWADAGTWLLGGVAVPGLTAYLWERTASGVVPHPAIVLVDAALVAAALMLQAALAARRFVPAPPPAGPAVRLGPRRPGVQPPC